MLRYLLSAMVFWVIATPAFAAEDEESQLACSSANHKLVVTHVEDTADTRGMYRFDVTDVHNQNAVSYKTASVDYFSLMDKLWQSGEIEFEDAARHNLVFKIDGAPFAKRAGVLVQSGASAEPMQCQVKAGLPLVSCVTAVREQGVPQYALQFRHATDMGTSTGYYISRVFKIFGSGAADFETKILGAFSLNRRLLEAAFAMGQQTQFQLSSGEKIVLTDWVSANEFKGTTNVGESLVPVNCSFKSGN